MAHSVNAVASSLLASFAAARSSDVPYRHWLASDCLPHSSIEALLDLPFEAPALGGISGKREVHNATRTYFDVNNQQKFPIISAFCEAFQHPRVTRTIEHTFGTPLDRSYLRIEYAQDTDGFWLEPHSDLGVKLFTFLLYLSRGDGHANLGTDIYDRDKRLVARSPFKSNGAMIFVPSNITLHGFEPRPIPGVRKSIIVNYVTEAWRAREQLAFPNQPVQH